MNESPCVSSLPTDGATASKLDPSAHRALGRQHPQRRVLFISYAFPPTGGGGVQRSVKFVKHLPQFGWRPTVLTTRNASVPLQDADLQGELDPSTPILRARTLEPPYGVKQTLGDSGGRSVASSVRGLLRRFGMGLLQPDPQVLWNPGAMRLAAGTLRRDTHEAIFATGPPFSSFLLGRALKKRFGLPLVLDFRDEWLLSSQYLDNYRIGKWACRRQFAMMNKCLKAADAVLATTQASAEHLARYCHQAGSRARVTCVYNGYDPDDMMGLGSGPAGSTALRLVYTGTLWRLTDVSPVVLALQHVASSSPAMAGQIAFALAGRRTPPQDQQLGRLDATPVSVERHDYVPHRHSLRLAASADVLLLLLADVPGAERVVPAKLFEYLALGKPILAIGPEGEATQLLREHGRASVFHPQETEKIANWIIRCGQQNACDAGADDSAGTSNDSRSAIDQFSRRALTGELASVLGSIVAG